MNKTFLTTAAALAVLLLGFVLGGCAGDSAATATNVDAPPAAAFSTEPLARFEGRDPGLTFDAQGRLHIAYIGEDENGPHVLYRTLDGEAVRVSPPGYRVNAHGEVPPVIVSFGDALAIAYTVALPGRFKGEIRVQHSQDDGATWSAAQRLHDDGQESGSHSFLDATVNGRGEAVFSWLDNRLGQQGLHTTTVLADGTIRPNTTVDEVACQCCATALHAVDGERVFLAYRDLDESGDDTPGVRDVKLMKSDDGGTSFAALGTIADDGWQIDACPHTGPRLETADDGALWAVWFTGAEPGIYVAASRDDGASFTPRLRLAGPDEDIGVVAHPEIGRLPDGRLAVFYEEHRVTDTATESTVRVRVADAAGGTWDAPRHVAEDGTYPRYLASDERAIVAFTRKAGEGHEVVVLRAGSG